jgi:hypothetical protein
MIGTKAASDGYWVVLEPLPPGEHTIEAKGCISQPVNFVNHIYHISVTP